MSVEPFLRGAQLLVIAAQRRAAIAGNEAGRVEPGAQVKALAVKRQADQRLNARHERFSLDKLVFVVQRNFAVMHGYAYLMEFRHIIGHF